MKTVVFILMLIVSRSLWGQLVVDNSQWFPPVRNQEAINNCSYFSTIYYLKTSIWAKELRRDPKLVENQFNHNFAWNQNIDPIDHFSGVEAAFSFMQRLGCATMADMSQNEQSSEIFPSEEAKLNALRYKSKGFESIWMQMNSTSADSLIIVQQLAALKDSLRNGHNFVMNCRIFDHFFDISDLNPVYGCPSNINDLVMRNSHLICVTGYNDTIKTPEGRGAFKVINSNSRLAGGQWYYDYNWFFLFKKYTSRCDFLQEDFSSEPEVIVKLDLINMVTGEDVSSGKYCFSDKLFSVGNEMVDYDLAGYSQSPRFILLQTINGLPVPSQNPDPEFKYLVGGDNVVLLPKHDHDGNRNVLVDLTSYISAENFQKLEILIQDPISANYVDGQGKVLYAYDREAISSLTSGYIQLLKENKRINAHVVGLPDTVVILKDYYSAPVGYHTSAVTWKPYIGQSTVNIRRFLVTFDIKDAISSNVELSPHQESLILESYPNPAIAGTVIKFSLNEPGYTTLKVMTLNGQEVAKLVSEELNSGEHQVNFDVSRLSNGTYVYILQTRSTVISKKMIVSK